MLYQRNKGCSPGLSLILCTHCIETIKNTKLLWLTLKGNFSSFSSQVCIAYTYQNDNNAVNVNKMTRLQVKSNRILWFYKPYSLVTAQKRFIREFRRTPPNVKVLIAGNKENVIGQ